MRRNGEGIWFASCRYVSKLLTSRILNQILYSFVLKCKADVLLACVYNGGRAENVWKNVVAVDRKGLNSFISTLGFQEDYALS